MSRRHRPTELEFLAAAEAMARREDDSWSRRVLERVDDHGASVGRDLPDTSIAAVLDELREEALDLGGWSLMAIGLARENGLPEHATVRLRQRLLLVASFGASSETLLRHAMLQLPKGA